MSNFRPDIWRLQANADIQGLIRALEDADSALRRRAAAALRALSAVEAIPALKQVLDQEHDPETRSSILAALAALELASRDTQESRAAVQRQPASAHAQAVEALVLQLGDSEPKQGITAALKLAKLNDMRAVEPLIVQFNNPAVPAKVRLMIAEALLDLDSAPGDVSVLGALRHPKDNIRRSAAAVLGQMQASWAVEPLAQALQDESESVREAARAALEAIDTADARAALTAHPTGAAASSAESPPQAGYTGPQDGLLRYIKTAQTAASPQVETTSEPLSFTTDGEAEAGVREAPPPAMSEADSTETPQKLTWPKREPTQEENISTMVTRPLNPRRVEEARQRPASQEDEAK